VKVAQQAEKAKKALRSAATSAHSASSDDWKGERLNSIFAYQSIQQVEHRIRCLLETFIHLVTKCFHGVNVHLETAPLLFFLQRNRTLQSNPLQPRGLLELTLV
jgi:hypothetical protein